VPRRYRVDITRASERDVNGVWAVEIATEPSFKPGFPWVLFRGRYWERDYFDETYYDVTPDHERFLMIQETLASASASLEVVLNWTEELERLVPAN